MEMPTVERTKAPARPAAAPGAMSATELAIHALAQLPAFGGAASLPRAPTSRCCASLDAYGLRGRVRFRLRAEPRAARSSRPRARSTSTRYSRDIRRARRSGSVAGCTSPIDESLDGILAGERIVVVTNYPAHYRLPLFAGMARRLNGRVAPICTVLFLSSGERSRPWLTGPRSRSSTSSSRAFAAGAPTCRLVPSGLGTRLRVHRPSIILVAGFSPFVAHQTSRAARELGATFGVWSGETPQMRTAQSRARRTVRLRIVEHRLRASPTVRGQQSYLRALSADLPIVIGRNTAPVPAGASRGDGRPDGQFTFVLIGDLANSRKGADVAIEAMRLRSRS